MLGIYDNEMKLEFVSKSSNEAFARIAVAAFASQLDPTIEEIADIKTAVSEAVTNCVIHGYEDSTGIIKVECKLKDNWVEIQISDSGKGIEDIELAKKPLYTTKANLERSGMGFTIMESFMDEMKVESIPGMGTKITMKKYINISEDKEELIENEKIKKETLEEDKKEANKIPNDEEFNWQLNYMNEESKQEGNQLDIDEIIDKVVTDSKEGI